MSRRFVIALCALCATLAVPGFAQSPAYPSRPVRIVVPFPAGGTTDLLARAVAQRFAEVFGQPFIVDNRPGAGGNLGAELVAHSAP
ncbi:MAG: Bug family tripartite tricarboxylate transporter substrate binding protein, partial [Burkholderiales bacterium]